MRLDRLTLGQWCTAERRPHNGRSPRWTVAVAGVAAVIFGCAGDDGGGDGSGGDVDSGTGRTGGQMSGSTVGIDSSTTQTADAGSDDVDPTEDSASGGPEAQWTPSHQVGEKTGRFLSVWGPSADNVYAVGGQVASDGSGDVGAMARFDGSQWTAAALPADTPTLNWVYGVASRRVVVGMQGTVLWRDGDLGEWTAGSCATALTLWGVWGAEADDLWAVGGDGFNKDPLLCHFDGTQWAQVELPEPSVDTHALFKIWGTSADNVFAVGDRGWIVHYDGTTWVEQASGLTSDLISLWGRAPDDILAVGGRSNAAFARWDGSSWTASTLEDVGGLNGVWMDASGDAVVVGGFGVVGRVAAATMVLEPQDAGTLLGLHAVFGLGDTVLDGPLFAAGGSIDMPPPFVGVVLRWPG